MKNRLAQIACASVACGFLAGLSGCGPKEEPATFDPATVKKDTRTLKDLPPGAIITSPQPSGSPPAAVR